MAHMEFGRFARLSEFLALHYAMPYCKGHPLALAGVVGGAVVGSVMPFLALPSLHLPGLLSCPLLWVVGPQRQSLQPQ
jgi:hypothetical protein